MPLLLPLCLASSLAVRSGLPLLPHNPLQSVLQLLSGPLCPMTQECIRVLDFAVDRCPVYP
jgi:hypothetical protein